MLYLQIHGLIHNLPLRKGIKKLNCIKLMDFFPFLNQRRLVVHTHLTETISDSQCVTNNAISRNISPNLVNYQRNSDEIPTMETNSLTKAMMQSSKSGFFKKNIWDKYITRSIELKDKFSVKNISIVMISASKSNIANSRFYELMSERLLTKCQNYLSTYKVDPMRFFSEEYRSEFTAFNIYTILSACSIAGYENEKLFKSLLKVSEVKLYYFEKYLDKVLNGNKDLFKFGINGDFKREDKFTFEDVAGILHVLSGCGFRVPEIFSKYSNIFKKMYYISTRKELDEIVQLGDVAPKAFAIGINSLVKLGNMDVDLYRIGLEYLDRGLEEISVRDLAMIFNSIFKIRASGIKLVDEKEKKVRMDMNHVDMGMNIGNEYQLEIGNVDLLLKLTNKVLDEFIGYNFDPECLASISTTFSIICSSNIFEPNEINNIKMKFNKLFEQATCLMIVNNEPDISTLVQLLQSSVIVGNTSVSMVLLTDPKFKTIGLMGSKLDILQYLSSIVSIYTRTKSKSLRELIENQFTNSISQYGKRINYVLYPYTMGLSQTKAKPPNLYSILKLESKGLLDQKATPGEINTDWDELTKEISEYNAENIKYLGSILNLIGRFNPCKEYTRFVSLSCDYFIKFFKLHSHELDSLGIEIESISAITHSLSKYRIKNNQLMESFSKVIKSYIDKINESREFDRINYLSLFNIINSYSKLGLPENRIFDIIKSYIRFKGYENKNKIKRIKVNKEKDIHYKMFRSISRLLGICDMEEINLQMVTNCLYSLSLVGFDKFSRSTLVRLMDRFIKIYPKNELEMINRRNPNEIKESTFVTEYIKKFDEIDGPYEPYVLDKSDKSDNSSNLGRLVGIVEKEQEQSLSGCVVENINSDGYLKKEIDFRGRNELKSQIDIISMMLNLMVKNDLFKTRVFQNYLRRIRKVMLDDTVLVGKKNKNMENGRNKLNELKEIEVINNNEKERKVRIVNKMSGFQRSVLTVLKTMYNTIRSEVCWRKGTYYIDVVIRDGRRVKFIEIDGPYHYYNHTTELVSSSKAKHFIISNYGYKLIHLPYYEWAKLKNEEERIKYLRCKIN